MNAYVKPERGKASMDLRVQKVVSETQPLVPDTQSHSKSKETTFPGQKIPDIHMVAEYPEKSDTSEYEKIKTEWKSRRINTIKVKDKGSGL